MYGKVSIIGVNAILATTIQTNNQPYYCMTMNNTTFTVYWMYKSLTPNALQFTDMSKALAWMEDLRKRAKAEQLSAITFCSEMADNVGKVGVDSVVDGKTPDGYPYDWNKSGRIGRVKGSQYVVPLVSTDTLPAPVDDDEWMTTDLNKSDEE